MNNKLATDLQQFGPLLEAVKNQALHFLAGLCERPTSAKNITLDKNNCTHASRFADFIDSHAGFELLAPVRLNTVCFTLKENQQQITEFRTKLNNRGKVFMTATVYDKQKCIRAAFVNWRTSEDDLDIATNEMVTTLGEL